MVTGQSRFQQFNIPPMLAGGGGKPPPGKEGFRKLDEKELRKKYEIFCDVWKLYRDHAKEDVQEWDWEEIVSGIDRITKQHNCELCYALCHAVLEEFERMEAGISRKQEKEEVKEDGRCEMD